MNGTGNVGAPPVGMDNDQSDIMRVMIKISEIKGELEKMHKDVDELKLTLRENVLTIKEMALKTSQWISMADSIISIMNVERNERKEDKLRTELENMKKQLNSNAYGPNAKGLSPLAKIGPAGVSGK